MKTVYIDESGYTGGDLLNKEQPYQAASAVCISDLEAGELIRKYFPSIRSKELKYGSLVRRSSNWENLLRLQEELLNNFLCVSYICDKNFLLILHFLDYAVEPFYFDREINFYEDGSNYALGSLLYYTADTLLKGNKFSEILSLFQYAMKSKTELAVSRLIERIKISSWRELPETFGPLAFEDESCINAIRNRQTSTDVAFIALISIITRLEHEIGSKYEIIHDRSKNLEQYNIALNKMINHENEMSFHETKLTTIRFPLHLHGVSQVDSKDSPAVQLSDVLVGGVIDASKAITGVKVNSYNSSITGLYRDDQLIHLLPSIDFEQEKEFRRGTQGSELIDYFSRHFS